MFGSIYSLLSCKCVCEQLLTHVLKLLVLESYFLTNITYLYAEIFNTFLKKIFLII